MQLADPSQTLAPSVEVFGPSLPLELAWCVHAADSAYLRDSHPELARLYRERSDLLEQVLGFWSDGMPCMTEAQVMAHHAAAFSVTDYSTFARVEATLDSIPLDLELSSETSEDRTRILARLGRCSDRQRFGRGTSIC